MGGFGAFLLPQSLRKRAKATKMVLLPPFLPSFKIDCETLRKGQREAHREHAEGQTGKPWRPESGETNSIWLCREKGARTPAGERQGWGLEPHKIVEQPWFEPRASRPAEAQQVMFYQNQAVDAPITGNGAQGKSLAFRTWVSCSVLHDLIWAHNLGFLLENFSREIQGVGGNACTLGELSQHLCRSGLDSSVF